MSRFDLIKEDDNLFEVINGSVTDALKEQTAESKNEKHVPFIQELEDGYLVKIGEEVEHPMTEAHYIEFIELIVDGNKVYRQYLTPEDKPCATFKVEKSTNVIAREYCNLHGLWVSEK